MAEDRLWRQEVGLGDEMPVSLRPNAQGKVAGLRAQSGVPVSPSTSPVTPSPELPLSKYHLL